MSSALAKRLDRLEALLAARVAPPVWRWQMPGTDAAAALADVVEEERSRTTLWRWLTPAEAVAQGLEMPPEPPQPRAPAQLPAPPELKLLAPPPELPKPDEAGGDNKIVGTDDFCQDDFTRVRAVPGNRSHR